jgi:hypothetical protein
LPSHCPPQDDDLPLNSVLDVQQARQEAAAYSAFSNSAPRRPLSLSLSLQFGGEHHNYQKTSLW